MVQNWVKRGFLSSPIDKKYDKNQFCRIITINMLKDVLPLSSIAQSISYINGVLDDKDDDLIDDSELYLYFVDTVFELNGKGHEQCENAVKNVLKKYDGPLNSIRVRLGKVLTIFVYAYYSATLRHEAMIKISQLDILERRNEQ